MRPPAAAQSYVPERFSDEGVSAATAIAPAEGSMSQVPKDQVIVLFGATGDLARRKLLPGMFHLAQVGLMPERFRIIGAARRAIDDEEFRELARESVDGSGRRSPDSRGLGAVRRRRCGSPGSATGSSSSARRSQPPAEELGERPGSLFYLSLPPGAGGGTSTRSAASGSARARG